MSIRTEQEGPFPRDARGGLTNPLRGPCSSLHRSAISKQQKARKDLRGFRNIARRRRACFRNLGGLCSSLHGLAISSKRPEKTSEVFEISPEEDARVAETSEVCVLRCTDQR
ncbi:hypothetical protein QUF80_09490 [Desulfococcaceae bacterium HSG8]|nr:hypothetical protein [Desulfococcaceae bacterium HSG8]